MASWLLDPYQTQFMRHALATAAIIGVLCPVVGVWVVLRRLAYLGDAMSHATLSGVAVAYLVGASIAAGALVAGLVMGGLISVLGSRRRLGDDTVIGVVETILFAVGVLIISRSDGIGVDLSHFLLGQITTVSVSELRVNGVLALSALVVVAVLHRDLLAATFDPTHARQVGIDDRKLRLVVLALVSVSVVVSLQTVGLLMSVAILVTPAATARLVTHRLSTMTAVAVVGGLTSTVGGLTASYHLDTPPGATIALTAAGIFLVVFTATVPARVEHRFRRQPAEPPPIAPHNGVPT
ncbi:MAG: metal ABC transporter permease [Acidimicrobiales bacterium]|nr:metal ABC transporter permease [Acidimicrobiales bacterium]